MTSATEYQNIPAQYKDSIAAFGYYVDGMKEGKWIHNDYSGQIYSETYFLHDSVNGTVTIFGAGGVPFESYQVRGGEKVGPHYYYGKDSTGKYVAHTTGGVEGRITKKQPKKIQGSVHVQIHTAQYGYGEVGWQCETDSSGYYKFTDLPPGYYTIRLTHPSIGYLDEHVTIVWDSMSVCNVEVQVDKPDKTDRPVPIMLAGFNNGTWSTVELRFGLQYDKNITSFVGRVDEFTLGSELNFNPSGIILGPKLNYVRSCVFLLFGIPLGASLIYFTDFATGGLYFTPQAGFEFLWFFRAVGCYNIPVSSDHQLERVSKFTFSLQLKIFNIKRYW